MRKTFKKRITATALAAAWVLSGCTTPYVVKLPDSEISLTNKSMEQSLSYLHDTRQAYRKAIEKQIRDEQIASNAFIGAGALMAALAMGNVHRDAVIGVAAAAGTGYALTNNNLPRSRLQIHVDSVKALNCAERAALPLAISDGEKAKLSTAVERLKDGRLLLQAALRRTRVARDSALAADQWRKAFPEAEAAVNEILSQTQQSVSAGEAFLDASDRAAINVASWVNDVRDNSIASLADARSPLAEVPRLIQGLTQDMGTFAPGAGVDSLVSGALKHATNAPGERSTIGSKSDLEVALDDLEKVARATAALQAPVNRALRGHNTTFAEDAFKDCRVAQVVTALAVTPTPLKFSAQEGGQRVLELKGGVKPYFLQLDGGPVTGLTFPTGPIRGGEAEISLKAGATTTGAKTGLRASDSSAAGQGVRIEIEIVAAPAAPASGGAAGGANGAPNSAGAPGTPAAPVRPSSPISSNSNAPAATTPISIDVALAALTRRAKFVSGGVPFQRKDLPVKVGDRIEIIVICPATTTTVFKRVALARSYLSMAGVMGFPAEKVSLTTEPSSCSTP